MRWTRSPESLCSELSDKIITATKQANRTNRPLFHSHSHSHTHSPPPGYLHSKKENAQGLASDEREVC